MDLLGESTSECECKISLSSGCPEFEGADFGMRSKFAVGPGRMSGEGSSGNRFTITAYPRSRQRRWVQGETAMQRRKKKERLE